MAKETCVLGACLALSGPEASYAQELRSAVELALEDHGAGAVELRVEDDRCDGQGARAAARRLASDPRVFAVIGPMNSWTSAAAGPIFSDSRLLQITPSASDPSLSRQGWAGFFRVCPNDIVQGRVLARVAGERVAAQRVAAVHDGTSFGEPLAQVFLEEARRLGMADRGAVEVRESEAESFAAAARRMREAEPDAVFVVGLEDPCREAAQRMRAAGLTSVFLGTDGIKPTHVLVTPGFTGDGPYLTNAGIDARRQAPEFHRRFQSRFGVHRSIYTVEAYDAARMCLAALARAGGPDRARVLAALKSMSAFPGLAGPLRFDATGERLDPAIGVYLCRNDELVFLGLERPLPREAAAGARGPRA
jgi:branched-chain amino acid transport system substrate-binding protein